MDYTVVVDASACIPKTFFSLTNIVQIPKNPILYTGNETIPSLITKTGIDPTGIIEESLEEYVKQGKIHFLYFRIDDSFTHNNTDSSSVFDVFSSKYDFRIIPTNHALMGCGWQAIHASEVLQKSGTIKEALQQAQIVNQLVKVVAFVEHPELLSTAGNAELSLGKNRLIANIIGPADEIIRRIPARNDALIYFRDYCTDQISRLHSPRIAIHHAATLPAASALEKWFQQKLPNAEIHISSLTRQATAKFGPRMLAIAWYDAAKI